ncbi:MAG: Rrf2 family transcriptional regulator [Pirellulales bacterium]|nr:Rrf2 family transcriptional regulator [Pirellulales bacterium]
MKISAKTEYACVAMLELAAQCHTREPVRIRKIAERHGVPPRFLVQILLQLKSAGLVDSIRGAAGGYQLRQPPEEISLAQIMDAVEGGSRSAPEQPCASSPDSPAVKVLLQAWSDANAARQGVLRRATLAELAQRAEGLGPK